MGSYYMFFLQESFKDLNLPIHNFKFCKYFRNTYVLTNQDSKEGGEIITWFEPYYVF